MGAHPPRNRRDVTSALGSGGKIYITYESAICLAIDTYIDDHCTRFDPLTFDDAWFAHGDDD